MERCRICQATKKDNNSWRNVGSGDPNMAVMVGQSSEFVDTMGSMPDSHELISWESIPDPLPLALHPLHVIQGVEFTEEREPVQVGLDEAHVVVQEREAVLSGLIALGVVGGGVEEDLHAVGYPVGQNEWLGLGQPTMQV